MKMNRGRTGQFRCDAGGEWRDRFAIYKSTEASQPLMLEVPCLDGKIMRDKALLIVSWNNVSYLRASNIL
jgi:hypothetical protein